MLRGTVWATLTRADGPTVEMRFVQSVATTDPQAFVRAADARGQAFARTLPQGPWFYRLAFGPIAPPWEGVRRLTDHPADA